MTQSKTLFDRKQEIQVDDAISQPADVVNFGVGAPDRSLLPDYELVSKALKLADQAGGFANCLQYGPISGDEDMLEALHAWLPVTGDKQLILTSGASQSLSNLVALFVDTRHSIVLMEDPTYFLAKKVILDHGPVRMMPVPQDSKGLSVDALEQMLTKLGKSWPLPGRPKSPRYPYLLYLVPSFNNPKSTSLPMQRRRQLMELALRFNILIVCDDVYDKLSFPDASANDIDGMETVRLVQLDTSGRHVISNGSFSKIFGPGIRMGWIETGPWLAEQISNSGVLASSGSANHFASSAILLPLLRSGLFDQHVNRLRSTLQHRCRALCQALRLYLPQTVQFSEPSGGYFVWLTLPVGASSLQFRDQCMREEHVAFAPGTWFFLTPDEESDRCMRLCFAFYDESVLMASAAKLGRCLHSYLASIQTGSPVLKGDLII